MDRCYQVYSYVRVYVQKYTLPVLLRYLVKRSRIIIYDGNYTNNRVYTTAVPHGRKNARA